ncbi:MAG: pectate lyase [Planctomycetota bacterium]
MNATVTMIRVHREREKEARFGIERRDVMRWEVIRRGGVLLQVYPNRSIDIAPTQCRRAIGLLLFFSFATVVLRDISAFGQDQLPRSNAASMEAARSAMRRASLAFREVAGRHGGYAYYVSIDGAKRWGEGVITQDQVLVQPPGTPTVGQAFLNAYRATGDEWYWKAAVAAAESLVHGQLRSGGWTQTIDFDPGGSRAGQYRVGQGDRNGRNVSSLDDDQTTAALRFLILVDQAAHFQLPRIHEAVKVGMQALLRSQMDGGGFPQVWDDSPGVNVGPLQARFPARRAQTAERIKEYWHLPTLNDAVPLNVARTLSLARQVYDDRAVLRAMEQLGKFLTRAQLPAPQSGWAQQYDSRMRPTWARKFEPPAVSGDETQECIETLLLLAAELNDASLLRPIESALTYLRRSRLSDGRLARFYEIGSNRPMYMERAGQRYEITFDDSRLPNHYGWKIEDRTDALASQLLAVRKELNTSRRMKTDVPTQAVTRLAVNKMSAVNKMDVSQIVATLNEDALWVSRYQPGLMVGQLKLPTGTPYLSSQVFADNLNTLAQFVSQPSPAR